MLNGIDDVALLCLGMTSAGCGEPEREEIRVSGDDAAVLSRVVTRLFFIIRIVRFAIRDNQDDDEAVGCHFLDYIVRLSIHTHTHTQCGET